MTFLRTVSRSHFDYHDGSYITKHSLDSQIMVETCSPAIGAIFKGNIGINLFSFDYLCTFVFSFDYSAIRAEPGRTI